MEELKNCPFCGGKAAILCSGYLQFQWHAYCPHCHTESDAYSSEKNAIEAWNRRAGDEELKFTRDFIYRHGLEFALMSEWSKRNE